MSELTLAQAAKLLGRTQHWVRVHASELGGRRDGRGGPFGPRWYFSPLGLAERARRIDRPRTPVGRPVPVGVANEESCNAADTGVERLLEDRLLQDFGHGT